MAVEREDRAQEAALLELTFDAILVRDFTTDRIQFWNRGAEELYGFAREEVIGRVSHDVLQTIHSIPLEEAKEILVRRGRWEGELVHTRRDGGRIVVASRWAVQRDGGRPVAILETNTDITERKEAEERLSLLADASALLASSLDYETTLRSLARAVVPQIADWCAVHLVDEDGSVRQITVTHHDPAKVELAHELAQRFPYAPDARAGVPHVLRTGRPELVPALTEDLLETLWSDPELLRVVRELGLTSWMVVPLIARERRLGAVTLVAAESGRHYGPEDVALAEVLARRAALAVDNARLYREAQRVAAERSAILSQMTDGVVLCDPSGVVTFMNDAARRLYGGDFVGRSLGDYQDSQGVLDAQGQPYPAEMLPLHRALTYGEVTIDAEARLHRPDGSEIVVERSATPVTAEDGARLGAVLTVRDVTAQRTLVQQKEEFLSAAAHDLKNPLTSLKALAQILQRRLSVEGGATPDQLREGLARIDKNATRMTALIDELLDSFRLQMGEGLELNRRPTDLGSLVAHCMTEHRLVTGTKTTTLRVLTPELIGNWDPDRLERVIANLLSNATKYSPPEAPIVVTVTAEEREGTTWAVVSVEDRGIGILPEDLPHIFERFHRGRNVGPHTLGTGIGLAGAKQIVEHHGGTIEVRSVQGAGSTFTVRLPLTPPA